MNLSDLMNEQDWDGGYDKSLPPILGFFNEYRFLSNFHLCPINIWGIDFSSSEQAYVYRKSDDPEFQQKVLAEHHPGKVKKIGSEYKLRPHWNNIRRHLMEHILLNKFRQNPELKKALLDTGRRYIEETNWWHDTYWGVCEGVGENNLGQLLMLVRTILRREDLNAITE